MATEAAMAIAKQNRPMTLAILLDMPMRSVFGEDEGLRKAKSANEKQSGPTAVHEGGGKAQKRLRPSQSGEVEVCSECTCRAQLHTSVIGPLLSPLGTDIADCHRAPRKEPRFRCGLRGEMSSSRRTRPVCPEQQDNKYVRVCVGGGVADARRER